MPYADCNSGPRTAYGAELMHELVKTNYAAPFAKKFGNRNIQFEFQFGTLKPFKTDVPIYFKPDPRLQNKKLMALELIDGVDMPVLPSRVDNPTNINYAWLTLVYCKEKICELPLAAINRSMNGNKMRFFRETPIDWEASYITFVGGALTNSNGLYFSAWIK